MSASRKSYNLFAIFLQLLAKMIGYFTGNQLVVLIHQLAEGSTSVSAQISQSLLSLFRRYHTHKEANHALHPRNWKVNKIKIQQSHASIVKRNTGVPHTRKKKINPKKHPNWQSHRRKTEKRNTHLRFSNKKKIKLSKSKKGMRGKG